MRLFKTLREIIRHPHPFRRLLQTLNNSPFRHVFRGFAWLIYFPEVQRRVRLAEKMTRSEQEQKAVTDLKQFGYARLTGLGGLQFLKELGDHGDWAVQNKNEFRRKNGEIKKSFWTELVDKKDGRFFIGTQNPLARFALQDSLIRIASGYLGSVPTLSYCLLTLSEHSPEKLSHSQLWHVDRDHINVLKVFVYLTDVKDVADGPFTFVSAPNSKRVKNSFFLKHLGDQDFFRGAKTSDVTQMLGQRFEIFAVDTTRCYHMGSRVSEGHARLMYTALYYPFASPYFPTKVNSHFNVEPGLTTDQRLLFGI